jgi:hypothetical protein
VARCLSNAQQDFGRMVKKLKLPEIQGVALFPCLLTVCRPAPYLQYFVTVEDSVSGQGSPGPIFYGFLWRRASRKTVGARQLFFGTYRFRRGRKREPLMPGFGQEWSAFLDTYRTLCVAPGPEIREIFSTLEAGQIGLICGDVAHRRAQTHAN